MTSPNDSFTATTTLYTGERQWGYQATWLGWRRLIMFGGCINVLAPAATLFVFGWQIHLGRLPVNVRSDFTAVINAMPQAEVPPMSLRAHFAGEAPPLPEAIARAIVNYLEQGSPGVPQWNDYWLEFFAEQEVRWRLAFADRLITELEKS